VWSGHTEDEERIRDKEPTTTPRDKWRGPEKLFNEVSKEKSMQWTRLG